MIPTWFLYLQGFALILLGAMQLKLRPRREGAGFVEKWVHLGTVWSLTCIFVGVALLAMAKGYWSPWPAPRR